MRKMKNKLLIILSAVLLTIGIGAVRLDASAAGASKTEKVRIAACLGCFLDVASCSHWI